MPSVVAVMCRDAPESTAVGVFRALRLIDVHSVYRTLASVFLTLPEFLLDSLGITFALPGGAEMLHVGLAEDLGQLRHIELMQGQLLTSRVSLLPSNQICKGLCARRECLYERSLLSCFIWHRVHAGRPLIHLKNGGIHPALPSKFLECFRCLIGLQVGISLVGETTNGQKIILCNWQI